MPPVAFSRRLEAHESSRAARAELDGVFRREAPRLLRYFRTWVGDGDEARDMVQESFARLVRGWGACGLARPEAYLQRIASRLLQDRRRRLQTCPPALDISDVELVDDAPTPEIQLGARERLRQIEAALAELPPKTRAIFLAHRLEGLSYTAIAVGRGVSVSAVEKHMMRAIAHLDRRFAGG